MAPSTEMFSLGEHQDKQTNERDLEVTTDPLGFTEQMSLKLTHGEQPKGEQNVARLASQESHFLHILAPTKYKALQNSNYEIVCVQPVQSTDFRTNTEKLSSCNHADPFQLKPRKQFWTSCTGAVVWSYP